MFRRTCALALVLAVGSTAVAMAATASTYSGKTSQHDPISLTVSGKRISKVSFTAGYGSCGTLTGTMKPIKLGKHGKFNTTQKTPDGAVVTTIKGQLKGRTITGSLTGLLNAGGIHPHTCKTGKLTFTAKLVKAK